MRERKNPTNKYNLQDWKEGAKAGIPIMLGYLSVSVGMGIRASEVGLSVLEAVILSLTNLTSAGQAAGLTIMAAGGSLVEMALSQAVINSRYALMALSMTQKTGDGFHLFQKLSAAYGVTDEIYAVSIARPTALTPLYMHGLILTSASGWVFGTFLGAAAGSFLPRVLMNALGIMLYGMFMAIFVPAAKKSRAVTVVVGIAVFLSLLFHYVLTTVSEGMAIILCAVAAAAVGAWLFPISTETSKEETRKP